jgi:hypothetical protein
MCSFSFFSNLTSDGLEAMEEPKTKNENGNENGK